MRTKKWFSGPALIALLLSVAAVQSYPESSQRKGPRVGSSGQGKPRSGVSDNWSGVTLRKLKVLAEQDGITVEITATRPVTPTLTRLTSPDRLVLDFPNTLSGSHQNVLAVNHGGVKSLRIGVQPSDPPMTRLVVDLLQPRTFELVAIGDTIVLKLRSVRNAGEAVVLDARTAIDAPVEIAAISDSPFPHNGANLNLPSLPGVTLKSTENRDHGSQPSSGVQESADPLRQTEDSRRNSSVTEGSGTTASSGQEVGQQIPAAGKPPTSDNGKPESQQAVNQVLPATGQGTQPSTPANGSNGTVSSSAAAGEMKAAPTIQLFSDTTAGPPGVQEIADPPTQAQDSSRSSSATGGSGTTASPGQEVGQQMPAEQDRSGGEGVPENRDAMAGFAKAAANGDANAQWKLGLAYLKGIGVPQDERKAAEWFKPAANQGHIRAQSALSDLYFDGRGVPRDYVRAYTWASIAAGLRGNDSDRLKVIGSRMTAVQIEEAHRRISSWWESQKLKPADPLVPVSLVAFVGDPSPRDAKDTKTTTSQSAPATPPQEQQQEQQHATSGNQSSQTDTPTASSEQNAAATIQQPANAPAQPNDEPKPGNGKPEPQTTVSQVLPATGQGAATPANGSNGTVSSPAAGGDVKGAPTNQPLLTNTTANPAAPESTVPPVPVIAEPGPDARAVSPLPTAKPMTVASDVPDSERTSKQPEIQPSSDDYVIGEQDVLTITVWKERELSGSVVVRPDGKITLPLVDDIKVVGLTPAQLRAILREKLKPYIQVPQVTVAVGQINSRKVYLIGEVLKTGTFSINSSTTVLQILAQAGGVKGFAKRKDIYILRNEQGKQVRHRFNYDEVIRGKNSEQNILLQPADTIIVP